MNLCSIQYRGYMVHDLNKPSLHPLHLLIPRPHGDRSPQYVLILSTLCCVFSGVNERLTPREPARQWERPRRHHDLAPGEQSGPWLFSLGRAPPFFVGCSQGQTCLSNVSLWRSGCSVHLPSSRKTTQNWRTTTLLMLRLNKASETVKAVCSTAFIKPSHSFSLTLPQPNMRATARKFPWRAAVWLTATLLHSHSSLAVRYLDRPTRWCGVREKRKQIERQRQKYI